jgi:hypothetical protein
MMGLDRVRASRQGDLSNMQGEGRSAGRGQASPLHLEDRMYDGLGEGDYGDTYD